MKNVPVILLVLLFFLSGCAAEKRMQLPGLIRTIDDGQQKIACADIFPQGKWQFVHSIEFTMKDGAGPPVIGVTTIDGSTIGCALVTVEGLTLFEAVYRGKESVEIRRAIPPFDKPGFARGLIGDIRAIFQPPSGTVLTGQSADAAPVCRYKDVRGGVVDVERTADDCWQINGYSAELLQRSIIGRSCRKKGSGNIPEYLELKTYGRNGYTLKMTLIRADNVP
ncbi:hypothetical protein FCL47_01840 [Desulfopila sp. IMCC35006]|uniref:hypothetical protein n=1 Tax=Desulfopila sp. IMCC35006 TaxID=2569542 RepID=UPI0010AB511D|nr:hypothetical protein [Desulfopila sp. IMCC35006]TKB28261.1 hypothetical protein FCL47_01840 [Desulfopila sp. IMCC35006]